MAHKIIFNSRRVSVVQTVREAAFCTSYFTHAQGENRFMRKHGCCVCTWSKNRRTASSTSRSMLFIASCVLQLWLKSWKFTAREFSIEWSMHSLRIHVHAFQRMQRNPPTPLSLSLKKKKNPGTNSRIEVFCFVAQSCHFAQVFLTDLKQKSQKQPQCSTHGAYFGSGWWGEK